MFYSCIGVIRTTLKFYNYEIVDIYDGQKNHGDHQLLAHVIPTKYFQ